MVPTIRIYLEVNNNYHGFKVPNLSCYKSQLIGTTGDQNQHTRKSCENESI